MLVFFFFFVGFLLDARAGDAYLLRFIFISLVGLSRGENLSGFCRRFHSMLKDYARTATTAAAAASATPSNEEMARQRSEMARREIPQTTTRTYFSEPRMALAMCREQTPHRRTEHFKSYVIFIFMASNLCAPPCTVLHSGIRSMLHHRQMAKM